MKSFDCTRRPSSRFTRWASLSLLGILLLGCGNYSNEDLAFVEALPEQGDLQAALPRQSSLTLNADDWYRTTKALIAVFNGSVEQALLLIGTIRHQYPTRRVPNGRIWGPYPAENKPGWSWMMVMHLQQDGQESTFDYELGFVPTGSSDESALIVILSGTFNPSQTSRGGHGTIAYDTTAARAQNVPLEDAGNLASLSGSYASDVWPKTIELTWKSVMPLPPPKTDPRGLGDPAMAHYTFALQESREGTLTYTFDDAGNPAFLPGLAGVDQLRVTSRWRYTGIGRSDVQVTAGDFTGATVTHCWDDSLQTSYTSELAFGGSQTGDLASCPYQDPPAGF